MYRLFPVNYKVELYDPRSGGFMPSSPGIGMHVEVRDPNDRIVLSRVYSSEGMISFTSTTPGEHVICMYSNSTSWFSGSQLRVSSENVYQYHNCSFTLPLIYVSTSNVNIKLVYTKLLLKSAYCT